MDTVNNESPLGGDAVISGTAPTEPITLNALLDLYLAAYIGRAKALYYRVSFWRSRWGDRCVTSITDEDLFKALQAYANAPARVYAARSTAPMGRSQSPG